MRLYISVGMTSENIPLCRKKLRERKDDEDSRPSAHSGLTLATYAPGLMA